MPNDATLAGRLVHQQMLPFELDANGQIAAVRATNALTLTFGHF